MRNIIIFLLFFCFANGQSNLFVRQDFAGGNKTPNTFIGGVSSTINTRALLATALGISGSRISNFKVVGSDIKCRISGSYSNIFFSGYPASLNTDCTYYLDSDGLITDVGYVRGYPNLKRYYHPNALSSSSGFYGRQCPLLDLSYFPNIVVLPNSMFYESNCNRFYVSRATTCGPTTGYDGVFYYLSFGNPPPYIIYCHPSLATNNGGLPDGDIVYAIAQGYDVRYVTNFTAPNPATSLSAGTITSTTVQLNFTASTGSTNAIDYYEVWINGEDSKKEITASGQNITGLTTLTNYNIELVAVDIFYNKSINSTPPLNVTTL